MLTALALTLLVAQTPQEVMGNIQRSHIEGNVPVQADFKGFLSRDLAKYLSALRLKTLRAEYELLRDGPTQSGVAYPKFYVWVRVFDGKTLVEEGAARVAAVDRKGFDITDYVDSKAIRAAPDALYRVFPAAVADKMKARLHIK
jgi:hypothetical protein